MALRHFAPINVTEHGILKLDAERMATATLMAARRFAFYSKIALNMTNGEMSSTLAISGAAKIAAAEKVDFTLIT
jgi:hypothetical protein